MDYSHLSPSERILMAILILLSNSSSIPVILHLLREKGHQFEGMIAFMSSFTSFMYHLCEVLCGDVYLTELEWHRLDNIFIISGMSIFMLTVLGNGLSRSLIYSTLFVSILSQERHPWDIRYTFGPIFFYLAVSLLNRFLHRNQVKVTCNWGNLGKAAGLICVGAYFFVKGLDETQDYLRFHHGMWHMFLGAAVYYGFQASKPTLRQKQQ